MVHVITLCTSDVLIGWELDSGQWTPLPQAHGKLAMQTYSYEACGLNK